MIGLVILAFGLVLIVEGLAYALAPSLVERLLEAFRMLSPEQRRTMGIISMLCGIVLLWVAHWAGLEIR